MSNAKYGENADDIDKLGRKYGNKFATEGVTTSQLRRIYSEVKRAENHYKHEDSEDRAREILVLLRPKLAYSASRSEEMEVVRKHVSALLKKYVTEGESMPYFFEIMEATVAYHAYYTETEGA